MVPKKSFFRRTKLEKESLIAENNRLGESIKNLRIRNNSWNYGGVDGEPDAISVFEERLKGVSAAISDLAKSRNDLDHTFELW